jgi:hypothetical protein
LITLGVNVAGDCAYLAVVDDSIVVDAEPYSLRVPRGLEDGAGLVALRDDLRKILGTHGIGRVRVLDPESNHKGAYVSFAQRYTIETLIVFAGAEQGLDTARISRSSVRSALSLPRSGPLQSHVSGLLDAIGPYWTNKRDLAGLAALAGSRSGDGT